MTKSVAGVITSRKKEKTHSLQLSGLRKGTSWGRRALLLRCGGGVLSYADAPDSRRVSMLTPGAGRPSPGATSGSGPDCFRGNHFTGWMMSL